jgi:hypothetical protein
MQLTCLAPWTTQRKLEPTFLKQSGPLLELLGHVGFLKIALYNIIKFLQSKTCCGATQHGSVCKFELGNITAKGPPCKRHAGGIKLASFKSILRV